MGEMDSIMKFQRKRKLLNRRGMSLAEALLATLIMSLVGVILATGVPVAKNVYERVVLTANAEVLLSTAISTLRNELSGAKEVVVSTRSTSPSTATPSASEETGEATGDTTVTPASDTPVCTLVTFYNASRGSTSRIFKADGVNDRFASETIQEGAIVFQRYAGGDLALLVSPEAATGDLYVAFESVDYNPATGLITFNNLSVNRENGSKDLAKIENYSIRVLSRE